jgi:hypothetical protein
VYWFVKKQQKKKLKKRFTNTNRKSNQLTEYLRTKGTLAKRRGESLL